MKPDLQSYDYFLVAFSGGKDSLACFLHLLDEGVPAKRIELWHHLVDGREGSKLMDWPCTEDYCRKVAAALGVPIYFSWKEGGFEREMFRNQTATAPIKFEALAGVVEVKQAPWCRVCDEVTDIYTCEEGGHCGCDWDGRRETLAYHCPVCGSTEPVCGWAREVIVQSTGGRGPKGTRGKFPQVSPDLKVRWCSPYLKIDVAAAAIRNQARFERARTLFVTGERAEESTARAKYLTLEKHRSDLRDGKAARHVDHWRPVHGWSREQVWEIIGKHRVNPHPAYRLGWGRVSCAACIFGDADQFASLRAVNPAQFDRVVEIEAKSGSTIKRGMSLPVLVAGDTEQRYSKRGKPLKMRSPGKVYEMSEEDKRAALSETFDELVILPEGAWKLPSGAFADSCGPT